MIIHYPEGAEQHLRRSDGVTSVFECLMFFVVLSHMWDVTQKKSFDDQAVQSVPRSGIVSNEGNEREGRVEIVQYFTLTDISAANVSRNVIY